MVKSHVRGEPVEPPTLRPLLSPLHQVRLSRPIMVLCAYPSLSPPAPVYSWSHACLLPVPSLSTWTRFLVPFCPSSANPATLPTRLPSGAAPQRGAKNGWGPAALPRNPTSPASAYLVAPRAEGALAKNAEGAPTARRRRRPNCPVPKAPQLIAPVAGSWPFLSVSVTPPSTASHTQPALYLVAARAGVTNTFALPRPILPPVAPPPSSPSAGRRARPQGDPHV